MNKIIAFGASSSKNSINKKLASYVANKIADQEVCILDLNDFEMPIYSEDRHAEGGIPQNAQAFKKIINESKGLVISLAEHNGSYTAAFKNIYDWISVIEKTVWCNKPILLMSTSDGARGGKSVLETALPRFSRQSNFAIPHFILPSFYENFSEELGITNQKLNTELDKQISEFKNQVDTLLDPGNN
ncbi:MAG: NAD(P)H-dependent oxidoreductase [Flavobacteriaceae bacterium]|nr:NAD(P)H-dependent oxidoreductase [Flavobacteriaceae bacterium]